MAATNQPMLQKSGTSTAATGIDWLTRHRTEHNVRALTAINSTRLAFVMKIRNSIKSLRARHRDNKVVRRRGRLYIINKTNRRFKARQG